MLTNHQRQRAHQFQDTQPSACCGPCDQGRKLCPCPEACAVSDELDPLTLRTLWADTPSAVRAVLIVAAAIFVAALTLHFVLR